MPIDPATVPIDAPKDPTDPAAHPRDYRPIPEHPDQSGALVDWDVHFGASPHRADSPIQIACSAVNLWYGDKQALTEVELDIHGQEVTALIGPSGCGKTTLLRCFNRMNDDIPGVRVSGRIRLGERDVYHDYDDPVELRARFGWVAQKPNPFPKSVYDNVAYGPRIHGQVAGRDECDAVVERALRRVGLWEEVCDRLGDSGIDLSGGQQQRLCIARAIAANPDVLLMDEPCSALDPRATLIIEELIAELREDFTIVIVTHNMQQAARIAQRVAFMHLGEMLEAGTTEKVFLGPDNELCRRYITGRFG
ncbi:MAG: phosphate ABC transporter ATP-binding protein PstB [Alphaproteobacteria bacterium]|nr:phosphate ABC transporter ATP-binding protein PstB [Alphaproteobacteria bacterium]